MSNRCPRCYQKIRGKPFPLKVNKYPELYIYAKDKKLTTRLCIFVCLDCYFEVKKKRPRQTPNLRDKTLIADETLGGNQPNHE